MPFLTLLGVCAVLSVVTFLVYAIDKHAARKGHWRVPENLLHLLSLAGGWPGALTAQRALRHKCSKRSFQFVFWLTVVLNLGLGWKLLHG
jgi:uncharacterized membrane protein YsdA (DUF1294 family)